jgi:hypothetical protein
MKGMPWRWHLEELWADKEAVVVVVAILGILVWWFFR